MPVIAVALVPVILALGGVGLVLLLVWGPVREMLARQDLETTCNALRARLSVLRTQGGSTDEQARMQAQLDDCQDALRAAGIEIDEFGELVRQLEDTRRQMRQEFSHLKSTDYSDTLKRGNTRSTILRLGEDLVFVYEAALAVVEQEPEPPIRIAQLQTLLKQVQMDGSDSNARAWCFHKSMSGCGRFVGSTEDAPQAKTRSERSRVSQPLKGVESQIMELLRELGQKPVSPFDFTVGTAAQTGAR